GIVEGGRRIIEALNQRLPCSDRRFHISPGEIGERPVVGLEQVAVIPGAAFVCPENARQQHPVPQALQLRTPALPPWPSGRRARRESTTTVRQRLGSHGDLRPPSTLRSARSCIPVD